MEYILLFIAALLLSFYLGMEWEKLKNKETIDFIEQYLLNKFGFSKDVGLDVIGQLKIMELIKLLKKKTDEKAF